MKPYLDRLHPSTSASVREAAFKFISPEPNSGCWLWDGFLADGYGRFSWRVDGKTIGGLLAHRLIYELEVGQIPFGLQIDHKCRNRACCNPAHLEPVTKHENMLRAMAVGTIGKYNSTKTHCKSGHEYTPENTMFKPGYKGNRARQCRQCKSEWDRSYQMRLKNTGGQHG